MPTLSRFSLRRRPGASSQDISTYEEQYQLDLQRQNAIQHEHWKQEQELYRRQGEEEQLKAIELQRQQHELYKRQQLEFQIQEAENRRQEQLRTTTPEALLRMQDLIRRRHELDLEIWRDRKVNEEDREILIQKGLKADEILVEIKGIVGVWEESGFQPEEWEVAKKIKYSIENGNQRIWSNNPAWNDRDA